jgi:hypothetical protein
MLLLKAIGVWPKYNCQMPIANLYTQFSELQLFYPQYRVKSKNYQPAFVDFNRLQVSVQRSVQTPVFNIVKQGAEGLVDIVLASAIRRESLMVMIFDGPIFVRLYWRVRKNGKRYLSC